MTLVPVTGAADDVERVAEAAVDGFVVWTTADDDPVVAAVAATDLPAVIHAGPVDRGLAAVGIDDRTGAQAIGAEAFAGARRPAVLSFPLDRARRAGVIHGADPAAATGHPSPARGPARRLRRGRPRLGGGAGGRLFVEIAPPRASVRRRDCCNSETRRTPSRR